MAEGMRDFLGAWDDVRTEVDGYRELDGERVLVLHHFSGRGKASGLEVGQMRTRGATLFQSHGGKVTRIAVYMDRERALADLCLPQESDSLCWRQRMWSWCSCCSRLGGVAITARLKECIQTSST